MNESIFDQIQESAKALHLDISSQEIAEISPQCKILCDFGFRLYGTLLASMIFKKKYSSSG